MPSFETNFFKFFGLEQKLNIDLDALQKRFYDLSRQWHPDKFSRKSAGEQQHALDATSVLNDGYRTLRDPVKRAAYLLAEEGFPIAEQRSKDVPADLLEEVFELNMSLEELKSGDNSVRPHLESAKANFVGMREEGDRQLQQLFSKYDNAAPESETARQALQEIRGTLNRRRYVENLVRDVDRALQPEAKRSVEDLL